MTGIFWERPMATAFQPTWYGSLDSMIPGRSCSRISSMARKFRSARYRDARESSGERIE
jgi:hypothetical protein